MALTAPRVLFGINSVALYNTTTGIYYGLLRVLKSCTFTLAGELIELKGGSNPYNWVVENGNINAELAISSSEYPDFIFQLFAGKDPTDVAAEASGNASALTNKNGTSMVSAAGLLAAVTVSTAGDLKFGKYVIKATGSGAANIYWSSNLDEVRGTDASAYTDDTLLIQSLTGIGSGSTHVITNHGLTLTAGASAGSLVTGDTATFEVRPVTTGANITATFGGLNDTYPEFGALCYYAKRSTEEMMEIDIFKCKAIGLSLGAQEKAFGEWSVTAKCAYDSGRSGVYAIRYVKP